MLTVLQTVVRRHGKEADTFYLEEGHSQQTNNNNMVRLVLSLYIEIPLWSVIMFHTIQRPGFPHNLRLLL